MTLEQLEQELKTVELQRIDVMGQFSGAISMLNGLIKKKKDEILKIESEKNEQENQPREDHAA